MVFDPFKNLGVLVSGIVVDDHMDRFLLGHPGIDDVEEADELLMAMALHTLADDLTFQYIKRRKQCRGAVTLVVVGDGAGTSLLHRQPRLGAVQRLDCQLDHLVDCISLSRAKDPRSEPVQPDVARLRARSNSHAVAVRNGVTNIPLAAGKGSGG